MEHTSWSDAFLRLRGACVVGICLAALALPLQANPTGGNVAAGSASIAGQGTSAVKVNQASNLAIINWQSFSINSGESTSFIQPSASSAALNRVLGGQTSNINGTLTANGQIYLVNGNGIVVGPGGVINANAFTASTRDISDADFLAGNLHFTGNNSAGVQNFGTITALGGNVVLIGKTVANAGTINAPNGTAGLVAGDDVLLAQKNADGSTITVNPSTTATSASVQIGVHNSGAINAAAAELKAANGNLYALAIQNSGIVRATTVQKQGGHIWLTSDSGTVVNSGTLNASATAAGGQGGTVTLKSATGAVSHTGQIIAQGGQGGVGGNAEISGAQLQFTGSINLTTPGGTTGNLLLDPDTLEIVASGGTGTIGSLPPTGDSSIDASALVTALDGANITLQANQSISVNSAVNSSANGSAGDLILDAPTLNLNAGISLKSDSTLSGNATTVNVGASGLIQNAVDAASTTALPTINLASDATYDLTSEIVIANSLNLNGNGAVLDGQNNTRVMEIDGTASGDTVNLSNLTLENGNGTSTLGAAGSGDNGVGGGLLVYTNSTTANVTITDSTLSNNTATGSGSGGSGIGGGIYFNSSGPLTLTGSTLSGNEAVGGADGGTGYGGGIYFTGSGPFTITDSTLSGNKARGVIGTAAGGYGFGGAIENDGGTLTITTSTLSGNSVVGAAGANGTRGTSGGYGFGGAIENDQGSVTILNSTLSDNSALGAAGGGTGGEGGYGYGGVIFDNDFRGGTLTIMSSTLSGNSATGGAGGAGGGAGGFGYGGAIFDNGDPLTITASTISGNSATGGTGGSVGGAGGYGYSGGIFNSGGPLTIATSTFSGNTATGGAGGSVGGAGGFGYSGGIFNGGGTATITASTISGNTATGGAGGSVDGEGGDGDGGGIYTSGTLTMINSTISGNSTTGGAGGGVGAGGNGNGGGIYNDDTMTTIMNSTISGNSTLGGAGGASDGGGIYNDSTLTLGDTILSGNTVSGGESDYYNGGGTLTDDHYNLVGQNGNAGGTGLTNGVNGDIVYSGSIGTILGSLTDNSGPTQTRALLFDGGNNPAIGGGGPNVGGYELDQRIYARPASNISIGAYDYNASVDPFIVTTETDPATGDLIGSLRTALNYGNANSNLDPTITFDASVFTGGSANLINLAAQGELLITGSLSVDASAVGNVTINAGGNSRVMEIDGSASGITVNLSNLTLENGNGASTTGAAGSDYNGEGGGIFVFANRTTATVTINNSTISGNQVTAEFGSGGGLYLLGGTVTINNSTLSNNQDGYAGGSAGAIFINGGRVTITDSTLSGNFTDGDDGQAGAIYLNAGTLTISDSTLSGNLVNNKAGEGGAIFINGGTLMITDSTLSGNFANQDIGAGGALYVNGGTVTINNSTISGNTATGNNGQGGAIFIGGGTLTIGDTILAGNTDTGGESDYYNSGGTLTDAGYNLYGQSGNDGGFNSGNGVTVAATDIELQGAISSVLQTSGGVPELASNGGPTQTLALVVGSPAYLAGGPQNGVTTDQRGVARGGIISIGAYDVAPSLLSTVVNTTADSNVIGAETGGVMQTSLRDAIYYSNAGLFSDPTITFDPTVFATAQTIALAQGELLVTSSLSVNGPTVGVTINASGSSSRVMEIDGTVSGITVGLSNLTLENGDSNGLNVGDYGGGLLIYAPNGNKATVTISSSTFSDNATVNGGYGGAIYIYGYNGGNPTLTITDSTFSNNSALNGGYGGAIFSDGYQEGNVTMTITGSTFANNSTTYSGGAIYNDGNTGSATLTISDSTFSGNSAGTDGGAFENDGGSGSAPLTITDSTISGNTSGSSSAGIENDGGTVQIGNTILAGNTTTGGTEADFTETSGTLTDYGYNLYGQNGNYGGFFGGGAGDIELAGPIGSAIASLGNYGGPTQTLALVAGSQAIDAGGTTTQLQGNGFTGTVPTTDQRGVTRGTTPSIGAYDFNASQLAISLVVTTANDAADVEGQVNGSGAYIAPATVSLRDALFYAALPQAGTSPVVTFDSTVFDGNGSDNTINLTLGQLLITNTVSVDASAVGNVTIDAQSESRVMEINGTIAGDTVKLTDLTLENGDAGSSGGGGLYVDAGGTTATVIIRDSTITDNYASDNSGGGIYNEYGTVTLTKTTVSDNTVEGGSGGGIINYYGTLTLNESTVSGNSVESFGDGGGIFNGGYTGTASLTVNNSTIANNTAPGDGGGIYNDGESGNATLIITNSTISGNSAGSGGGIYNQGGSVPPSIPGESTGEIAVSGTGSVTIGDTILAGNTLVDEEEVVAGGDAAVPGGESDYANSSGTLTDAGYNLYGQSGDTGGFGPANGVTTQPTDIKLSGAIGTALGSLGNYGGPTETLALVAGSPALGNGSASLSAIPGFTLPSTDQRGDPRETGPVGAQVVDIGAYQDQGTSVTANVVAAGTLTYGAGDTVTVTLTPTAGQNLGTVTLTDAVNNDTFTGTLALQANGTYVATIDVPVDFDAGSVSTSVSAYGHYAAATANTLTVNPEAITVAVNSGGTSQYGLTPTDPGITLTAGTLYNGNTLSGLGVGDSFNLTSASDAGTYTINVTGYSGLANYTVTPVSANYVISKAALTVAVNSGGTSQYGLTPTDPGLGVTGGTLYNGDTLSGLGLGDDFNLTSANNAGTYTINVTGYNGLTNYTVTPVSANYVISKAALTVAVNSGGTSQYGLTPTDPGVGVTSGALYNGDTLSGLGLGDDFNLTSANNAGSYTINVTGYSGLANYTVTPESAPYVITKAPLTIAINSGGTSQYGLTPTDPGFGVTSGTLYNGNTLSGLGVGDDFSLTSASGAGTYAINVTSYSGLANYTVTPVSANYVISKAALTVAVNSGGTSVYGGTPTDPGIALTVGTLYNGDTLTSLGLGDSFNLTAASNAGTYTLNVTGASTPANYAVTPVSANYTITPATLTYVANPVSRNVGAPNPDFTGTVTGFVNGQTLADATSGTLAFNSSANGSSQAGRYAIDGSGLTADFGNYLFVQASGNATALTLVAVPPPGQSITPQPVIPVIDLAQFDTDFDMFFNQSRFPVFDPALNGWLIPVFSPGKEPHPFYSTRGAGYAENGSYDILLTGSTLQEVPGAPFEKELVTPDSGIFIIYNGAVYSGPVPPFVWQQLDLLLGPDTKYHLGDAGNGSN